MIPLATGKNVTSKVKSKNILLLSGIPGIGKTTVIRKLADQLAGQRIAGFYTAEIRIKGIRQGFELIPFQGSKRVIAHVDFAKTYQVGKYGVDVAAIDAAVNASLTVESDVDVYFVDEVGKMECLSSEFVAAMHNLLASEKVVVATVAAKGRGFIEQLKQRQDIAMWELTKTNRDGMAGAVIDWLKKKGVFETLALE